MYDVIIVGAGVAGMTAGIYAVRAGKSVLILEGRVCGGQIVESLKVGNWPGEIVISGSDLTKKIYKQVEKLGAKVAYEKVEKVSRANGDDDYRFAVVTDEAEYKCKALIIATGTVSRKLGIPREDELAGRGISYCATCDGAFYKGKKVAVIGGGNSALYEALYLSKIASLVYLVHRNKKLDGDYILVEKLKTLGNVEFVPEANTTEIVGENKVEGIKISQPQGEKLLEVDGLFVAIGRVPSNEIFSDLVKLDEQGYVVAGEDCHTSCPGVFVAGDCRTKKVRQLVTAVADGAVAAIEAAQ